MKRFFVFGFLAFFVFSTYAKTIYLKGIVLALSESLTATIEVIEKKEVSIVIDNFQYSSKDKTDRFFRIGFKVKNNSSDTFSKDEQFNQINALKLLCYNKSTDSFIKHDLDYSTLYWNLKKTLKPNKAIDIASFFVLKDEETPVALFTSIRSTYLLITETDECYEKTNKYFNE